MKREREKKYVTVDVRFSEDGRLRPLQIVFDASTFMKSIGSKMYAEEPQMWAELAIAIPA